jgi:hypothetical protein
LNHLKAKLKASIRSKVRRLLARDAVAKHIEASAGKMLDYLRIQRTEALREIIQEKWLPIILKNTQIETPFGRLNYDLSLSFGSALYPKLTGTYESELHADLRRLLLTKYDIVVDIGAAEGFYAVGLAKVLSGVPVMAYDISERARCNCRQLAQLNGVSAQVTIQEYCDSKELTVLCDGRCCLIVCDCEGFERYLFDAESVAVFRRTSLLVEVHDCFYPGTGQRLLEVFGPTHDVRRIDAVNIVEKIKLLSAEVLRRVPLSILDTIVDEHRPAGMYWLIFEPKS